MGIWSELGREVSRDGTWGPFFITCQHCGAQMQEWVACKSWNKYECEVCGKDPRHPPEEWLGKELIEELQKFEGVVYQDPYWRRMRQELLAFAGFGFQLRDKTTQEIFLVADDWYDIRDAWKPRSRYEGDNTRWWSAVRSRVGTERQRAGDAERVRRGPR